MLLTLHSRLFFRRCAFAYRNTHVRLNSQGLPLRLLYIGTEGIFGVNSYLGVALCL
jgi:hypothetical protein